MEESVIEQVVRPKVGLLVTALLEDDWNKTAHLRPAAQAAVQNFVSALEGKNSVVCPGLVETEEQAAAADLAFKAAGVEAVVFAELAYTQSLVPMRALSRTQVPIIVWNTQRLTHWPQDADWDLVMLNSGLAGVPEATHALVRSGRRFQIVTGHLKDAARLERLQSYLNAAALMQRLRWARIGMVGHPYQYMADLMVDPFALRETFGPTVVHIEPEEIAATVAQVSTADGQALIAEARQMWRTDEMDPDIFERSARYALGLERSVRAHQLDALAHFDQCLLSDPRCGVVPSWGEARLMALGIPVTAEADLLTATGMLMLQGLAGAASFVENYGFDFDSGAAYLAHDSIGNPNLAAPEPPVALRHSVYYQGMYGMGAALEFGYRPGPVTLLSLVPTAGGGWKMIIGEGEARPLTPRPTVAPQMLFCASQSSLESFYDRWCLAGAGHHSAVAYGHLGSELATLAEMIGIDCATIR
jgi:L-arabinose isomerase